MPSPRRLDSYPAECECIARLLDGSVTSIRPIRPTDADPLSSFHDHLSGETVYRRFFGAHPHLRDEEITRFTEVDYRDRLALVAEVEGGLVGVARYDRSQGTDRAEVAFVVADPFQGHGLGTLLLEHLAVAARRRGIATFEAQTLSTNYPMQGVFGQTGFDCVQRWGDGVVEVSFPIAPTQRYLEAVINRDGSGRGSLAAAPPGICRCRRGGSRLPEPRTRPRPLGRLPGRPSRRADRSGDRRARHRRRRRVVLPGPERLRGCCSRMGRISCPKAGCGPGPRGHPASPGRSPDTEPSAGATSRAPIRSIGWRRSSTRPGRGWRSGARAPGTGRSGECSSLRSAATRREPGTSST